LGVHWGKLSLTGHQTCRVERRTTEPVITDESITLVNPQMRVDSLSTVSLRQQLIAHIVQETGASRDDLAITFSKSDNKALSQSAFGRRFEVQPKSTAAFGRVPFVVREWRDRSVVNEYRVTADVALWTLAVVATRGMQRGAAFGQADVEVREVLVRDSRGRPLSSLDHVVGQTARGTVRLGDVIYPDHLRSPLLVRRGELILVRGVFGGFALKFFARARADGEFGQIVMCRRDGPRKELPVRITGLRRGETVAGDAGFDSSTGRMALK
jgi:flagella basal body P-ring formation protein FlgA